jgi:hypothetical protein
MLGVTGARKVRDKGELEIKRVRDKGELEIKREFV